MTVELAAPLVLASSSPRRKELLELVGIPFSVVPSRFDERELTQAVPEERVRAAAANKTLEVMGRVSKTTAVLGADTIVALGPEILGKPADARDARAMLSSLMGRTHRVLTGFCLGRDGDVLEAQVVSTSVTFRDAVPDEIERYVATGEGRDKAGSYAIQGLASGFAEKIDGSYSNVVGLPLTAILGALRSHGLLLSWP